MNAHSARATLRFTALLALTSAVAACDDPNVFLPGFQAGGPAGVLDGAVTYSGPLPCTENGHVLGAAVLLVFDTRLLPPPEGLGTTATSLGVVAGDALFAGIRGRLTFNSDGSRWCPAASAAPVTVAHAWAVSPLPGGTYQVRGFYDLDGNFDPAFKISNLPTRGDIGGGAIDNAAEVLVGKAPRYREITLGADDGKGGRTIPPEGARIGGVAVTLGLPLPLERPIFYLEKVLDETPVKNAPTATEVKLPSDFQLAEYNKFNPAITEASFVRVLLHAGVPKAEESLAVASPFNLPVKTPSMPTPTDPGPGIFFTRQDVDGNGMIDANDHVPDSKDVPSLWPFSVFSKVTGDAPNGDDLTNQASPAVIMQGLTIYKSLNDTAFAPPTLAELQPEVTIALRPAALCLDPADNTKPAVLVVSRQYDAKNDAKPMMKNPILSADDEKGVEAALGAQFHRTVKLVYGCLPQGRFAMNLIYQTGQAWTVPNEAGICAAAEPVSSDGKTCSTKSGDAIAPHRARLASQDVVVTVVAPTDAKYCAAHPTPPQCALVTTAQ